MTETVQYIGAALFASGTFLFHTANLYPVLLVVVASMACLEIFNRMIGRKVIRILISNKRKLRFAATSLLFIDIYLLVLSIVYDSSVFPCLFRMPEGVSPKCSLNILRNNL